ncbi:MAG: glycosyltransferase family 9 protein, partial [Deltaproteobacteria bacterium]
PIPPARPAIIVCENAHPAPPDAQRILILRLGAVGDVVRTLPAARMLREAYPRAHLAWLVERGSAALLERQPWIDEIIVFPREALRADLRRLHWLRMGSTLAEFVRRLRAARFDLVVDFHAILKSGVLAWASRSPRRVSYARPYGRELSWLFATERARLSPRRASRFDRNTGLVHFLGIRGEPARVALAVDPDAVARLEAAMGDGVAPIAIHPGTSDDTPYKRYTVTGYAAVARALFEGDGLPSIVTHGPARGDLELAERIVAAARGAARLAPPTPSLVDLAALFSRCRAYVGSDTGPMHVASLVGIPVVQILGPTDPLVNAPYPGTPSRSVRVPVPCSPCRRGCAAATCMRAVSPEQVIGAVRELIGTRRARPAARVPGASGGPRA